MTENAPTLDDLMAKVGYFVFHWGQFEAALVDAIKSHFQYSDEIPSGVSDKLAMWRRLASSEAQHAATAHDVHAKALKLRGVRNQIVHGLVRARSHPGTPYIECVTLSGGLHKYTIDELAQFTQSVDACRRAMLSLNG